MINVQPLNGATINGRDNTGKVQLPLEIHTLLPQQVGILSLDITIVVSQKSFLSLPLQVNVHWPQAQISLPLKINCFATGNLSQPLAFNVYYSKAFQETTYRWKVKLLLDSMDVSLHLIDTLRIEAEEGTAKIAEFSLVPFAGPIAVTKWIGKSITIFYLLETCSSESLGEWLLFQGVVDEPIYHPTNRITTFTCTDQLQERIQNLNQTDIDQLIGGYLSEIVFEKTKNNWQYAQNQLSTLPACLDLDKNNQFSLTLWKAKETSDFIFTSDNIIYQSIEVQLANRREIQNKANIVFQYRYQRLKQREIQFGYQYALNFCEQNYWNATMPNVDMIGQAVSGTGWWLKNKIAYVNQRGPGWVSCGNIAFGFLISEEIRKYLVREARFILAKRFTQNVTENFHLQLKAPQSIQQFGEIPSQESVTLEVPADTEAFLNAKTYQAPQEKSVIDNQGDYVVEVENRGKLNQAMVTKLNQIKTSLLKSHRNNVITFKTILYPLVERMHTLKIDTENVKAQGKVKHIIHEFDFNQGLCLSTIAIAVSRTDDDTVVTNDLLQPLQKINHLGETGNPLFIGLATHLGGRLDSPPYDEKWDGYTGNKRTEPGAKTYPERFAITAPAIEDAQVAVNYDLPTQEYQFSIPNELLLLTA